MPRKKTTDIKPPKKRAEPDDDEKLEQESVDTKSVETPKKEASKEEEPAAQPESAIAPELAAKVQAELSKIKAAKAKNAKVSSLSLEKPTVEGINAPKITSEDYTGTYNLNLTDEEKQLISETPDEERQAEKQGEKVEKNFVEKPVERQPFFAEKKPEPKLMPASVVNRATSGSKASSAHGKKWALIILLAFVIGIGSYKLYSVDWSNSTGNQNNTTVTLKPQPQNNGYIATTTIDNASSTPATSTTPSILPPAPEKQVKINSTPTNWLNFRSGPGTNYSIITKVYPGEGYPYTEIKSGWYKITLKDGRTGWVIGTYVSEVK